MAEFIVTLKQRISITIVYSRDVNERVSDQFRPALKIFKGWGILFGFYSYIQIIDVVN